MPATVSSGNPGRGCRGILLTAIFALLCTGNASAEKDPYLDMLEAEAGDTDALQIDHTQSDTEKNRSRDRHTVPKGLSFSGFEQALQNNYAGTNALYNSLNNSQRKEVYKQYQHNRSVAVLRQKILSLQVTP